MNQIENIGFVELFRNDFEGVTFEIVDGVLMAVRSDEPEDAIALPPGPWRYVCLSTEMTEEMARKVVERWGDFWRNYKSFSSGTGTALASFATMLTAAGCDANKPYAVIKRVD